jgi:hypothetical protein
MRMQKGAPILRLALRVALSCGLRLELTYRDPSVPERINELRKENQERAKAGLSTALAEHDSRRSQRMRTHILSLRDGPDFDPDAQQAEVQRTMHAKVLDSESYPLISFHSTKLEKTGVNQWIVSGEQTLHGQSRSILADVRSEDGAYTGRSKIKQTDFGISPVSGAGGVAKVKNELGIQFVVVPIRYEKFALSLGTAIIGAQHRGGGR